MPPQSNFELHLETSLRRATSWQPPDARPRSQDCRGEGWCRPPRVPHSWPQSLQVPPGWWNFPAHPEPCLSLQPGGEGERWHGAVEGKRARGGGAPGKPGGFCHAVEQDQYFTSALIFGLLLRQMVKHRLLPGLLICKSPITGTHHASLLPRLQSSNIPFYRLI